MGHLHTKTMNRLQADLLEHNFVIQYKKGEIMPADYLSRLPSANNTKIAEISVLTPSSQTSMTCKGLTLSFKT
jgi:hypothetical protein